jgi:predicted ATPase
MFFEIKNIGKIKNAEIELNGITVLTGNNNTGKSTFGKVLFCALDAFRNMKEEIRHERQCGLYDLSLEPTDDQIQKRRITHRFKKHYGIPTVNVNSQNKSGEVLLVINGDSISVVLDSNNKCVDFSNDLEFQHNVFYVTCHPIFEHLTKEKEPTKDRKINDILYLIDSVVGGDLERIDGTIYFRENGSQGIFNASHLSCGLRLFLAIKGLLEYGIVQEQDVLIFDKPETSLHPEWQIILGEVLVLLQQAFNLTILLTTHSAYFLDALEVFSSKYRATSRYYVVTSENGFSNVQDVTANTDSIYACMAKPFQTLENIRYS